MRTRLIAFASVCIAGGIGAATLSAASMPAPVGSRTAAVGDVVGSVTVASVDDRTPPMLSPYARRRYTPPSAQPSGASLENVVVYVLVEGSHPARGSGAATILQRDRTIIPHVTAVQVGARIDFPNGDEVFHNLFSLSDARPFNFGRYAPGESRAQTFDRPGIVRMYCDIHSEMSATIVVLDTPYFARPDANGEYRIRGVPEGRHTLVAWHESAGITTREIVVTAGRATGVDLRIPG